MARCWRVVKWVQERYYSKMLESQSSTTLSSGEQVEVAKILCPDVLWAEHVEKLLSHKGEPWNWQNSQFLRTDVGFETRFYVLHRNGLPFANVLLSEGNDLGIVNHVWTIPEDRQKGSSKSLMQIAMGDFKTRQGQALFLQAGYGEIAYHMYQKFDFESIEPQSGYMHWYTNSEKDFLANFFADGQTKITPLEWRHWLTVQPLLQGNDECITRVLALKHIGRRTTEGAFLTLLRDEFVNRAKGEKPRAYVLELTSGAVVGFVMWSWHPLWPDTCLVDVYCHAKYWDKAQELLSGLELPKADRYLAYADCETKKRVLLENGFEETAVLKNRVETTWAKASFTDVAVFERKIN
jgi:hypothetical protein